MIHRKHTKTNERNAQSTIIIIFSLLVLILLILFVWQEWKYFNLSARVDDEKINNFFASIGALLTGVSIIYISLQIEEGRKSREAMFLPDIIPKDTSYVSYNSLITLCNRDASGYPIQAIPFLELFNAGAGAAKKIHVIWSYSGEEVIKFLTDNNVSEINRDYKQYDREDISYIPVGQTGKVEPSRFYFQLYRTEINPTWDDYITYPEQIKYKPELVLKVNFLDMFGNRHFSKYSAKIVATDNSVDIKFMFIEEYMW